MMFTSKLGSFSKPFSVFPSKLSTFTSTLFYALEGKKTSTLFLFPELIPKIRLTVPLSAKQERIASEEVTPIFLE